MESPHPEMQYLHGLFDCLYDWQENKDTPKGDRTGTGTYGVFGRQWRFDLSQGFPLLTTKKLYTKGIVAELLWMLSGDTNIKALTDQNVHIWDEWADKHGHLGPVYGAQWRSWNVDDQGSTVDQIEKVIHDLKVNPTSRRHIVSAWNVGELDLMALAPCHCLFQFYVDRNNRLSCQLYQRSADIFLGVPFNIASYALLTHLVAREVGLEVGEFVHTFGDLHLYSNHVEQAIEQIKRQPKPLPKLHIVDDRSIFDMDVHSFVFEGYDPHPAIKAEVSV